mgnify:FL=1
MAFKMKYSKGGFPYKSAFTKHTPGHKDDKGLESEEVTVTVTPNVAEGVKAAGATGAQFGKALGDASTDTDTKAGATAGKQVGKTEGEGTATDEGTTTEMKQKGTEKETEGEFVPAWEGADISKKKWDSMTKAEKDAYTEKYGD